MGLAGEDTPFVGDTPVVGRFFRTARALRQREANWPAEHAVSRTGSDRARVICPPRRQPCTEIRLGRPESSETEPASVRGRGSQARLPTRIAMYPSVARPAAARYPRQRPQLAPRQDYGQASMLHLDPARGRGSVRALERSGAPHEASRGPGAHDRDQLRFSAVPQRGSGCPCEAAPVATEPRRSGRPDASLARGSESARCCSSSWRR